MDAHSRRQRAGRSWLMALWLGALALIGTLALSQRPAELAARPDLPIIVVDESLTIHPSALITTPEEAAVRGLAYVQSWTGAEHPRTVKVELLSAHSASGFGGTTPAWRISFDSAEFGIRCPPVPPGSAVTCPPGVRARVAFFASDGGMISLAVGRANDVWE